MSRLPYPFTRLTTNCGTGSCRLTSCTRFGTCCLPAGITRRNIRTGLSRSSTSCCSLGHADELFELLRNRPAKVNLIPFNPFPGTVFKRSSAATIRHFQNRLRQHGIVATTRKTRGEDIDAACGQLAGDVSNRVRNPLGRKKIGESKIGDRNIKVASA